MFDIKDLYVLIAAFAGAVIGGIFTLIAGHFQNKRMDNQNQIQTEISAQQIAVQKEISSKQIKADIILRNEQNSTNELKNYMAEYLSLWQEFTHKLNVEHGRINQEYYELTLRKISDLSHKLFLSLNRDDQVEEKLYMAIHNSVIALGNISATGQIQMESLQTLYANMAASTQVVIQNRIESLYEKI